jgi:homocysteine S-methyltransferase
MPKYRHALPQLKGKLFLGYFGMETDLIFNRGVDLPGFAAYTLLEREAGREILRDYCSDLIALARRCGAGVILESPTWVANRDRGNRGRSWYIDICIYV